MNLSSCRLPTALPQEGQQSICPPPLLPSGQTYLLQVCGLSPLLVRLQRRKGEGLGSVGVVSHQAKGPQPPGPVEEAPSPPDAPWGSDSGLSCSYCEGLGPTGISRGCSSLPQEPKTNPKILLGRGGGRGRRFVSIASPGHLWDSRQDPGRDPRIGLQEKVRMQRESVRHDVKEPQAGPAAPGQGEG